MLYLLIKRIVSLVGVAIVGIYMVVEVGVAKTTLLRG
jgi:hypothetical protein